MTDHVTPTSHPELTDDQRAEANEAVDKWSKTMPHGTTWSELANAVERIVAEVTAADMGEHALGCPLPASSSPSSSSPSSQRGAS